MTRKENNSTSTSIADAVRTDIAKHGRNAPTAISSQSRLSKRDSNMTINDCKTSGAKEIVVFLLSRLT